MKNACINNLRMVESAKQRWALENKREDTDTPKEADLARDLNNQRLPVCPAGGTYTINAVNEHPVCSNPNHASLSP